MTLSTEEKPPNEPPETDESRWWKATTGPFTDDAGIRPAQLKLQQIDDNSFMLLESFRYDGRPTYPEIRVTPELLGATDLASIPSLLGWFARRHGRHTFAALVHDQLVRKDPARLPPEQQMARRRADRLFREALRASGVPVVKRWVLWTGVSVPTLWHRHGSGQDRSLPWRRLGFVSWCLAGFAGTVTLVYAVATHSLGLTLGALLAPIPLALLWGRLYAAGLVAGYAVVPIAFATAPVWLTYQCYRLVEYIGERLQQPLPGDRPVQKPAPFDKR